MEENDGREDVCKIENYKAELIDLINGIERLDILEYLHYFVKAKFKAE